MIGRLDVTLDWEDDEQFLKGLGTQSDTFIFRLDNSALHLYRL